MAQPNRLSVIIVTFDSEATIAGCLRSLKEAARGIPLEVIIIDNQSVDRTLDIALHDLPDAVFIRNKANLGFAAACNLAAARATGEWLFFLNPDVELDPGSLIVLLSHLRQYDRVGLGTMRLRYPDGSFQPNCRQFPTVTNLLFSRGSVLGRLIWQRLSRKSVMYTLPDYPDVTSVPAVSATAIAIRKHLFTMLHGFDTRYFLYMEDTDLSYRLHLHRHVNLFVPQAGAVHGWGRGSTGGKIFRAYHHHQSVWRYFLKYQATGFALIVLPAILMLNFLLVCLLPERRK